MRILGSTFSARCFSAALLAAGLVVVCGCEKEHYPSSAVADPNNDTKAKKTAIAESKSSVKRSPLETVRFIHQCRTNGKYQDMLDSFEPEHRSAIMSLVLAVDELVAAEARLQRKLRENVGEGTATHFGHRTQVANILGPLSRDVKVVSEKISGDTAEVSFQVASRLPLESVKLKKQNETWLMVMEKTIPELAVELRNLAGTIRRVADELAGRNYTAQQVYKELNLRQQPILERIAKLVSESQE